MFNPHQLLKHNNTQTAEHILRPSSRCVIQKMTDHSKSRWDEPISVPEVLYMKYRLPLPHNSSSKQSNKYPLSLIDFIKKAYDKCKDETQSKAMENELKSLLSKHENDYHAVNWETMPLPCLPGQKRPDTQLALKEATKKQTVNLHKQYSSMQPQEETISKVKMKFNLQKLEERLNKKNQMKEPPKKAFVGFTEAPEKYQPPPPGSFINPSLRVIMNPIPPPPPPSFKPVQPFSSQKMEPENKLKSKALEQKFSKESSRQVHNPITVVTSTTPEPVNFNQRGPKRQAPKEGPVRQRDEKGKNKIIMTKKQLNEISKVAEKVSDLHQVAKRFELFNRLKQQPIKQTQQIDDDYQNSNQIIVGRNTSLDKPYLRITGRPDPETVRPLPILKKALPHFLQEYKKGTIAYDSLISQLKSIRQDLTVQHIRDPFTVEVYEENFKISLFESDIIQVRQCQANLWELYREGLYWSQEQRSKQISYKFITLILQEKYKELEYMLTLLPEGTLEHPDIQDSLKLKQILLLGNYRAFFDFYNERDQICRQLLNIYIDKVRMRCLVIFSKTCGQRITFKLLGQTIGEDEDVIEALATGQGAVIREGFFMLKESYDKLSKSDFLVTKKVTNLLI